MRIHTGVRPYKCTYCDRAFTQSNDLTLHIRRHTGDKPYVCGICGDRFIQGTALQTHRRMQGHFEDNQPTPFASISVNNPNRYTNANRVNRIGITALENPIKKEINPVNINLIGAAASHTMGNITSGNDQSQPEPISLSNTKPSTVVSSSPPITAPRSLPNFGMAGPHYLQNGNPFLSLQNLEVPPIFSMPHFNHGGYN